MLAFVDRDTVVGASVLGVVPVLLALAIVGVKWWRSRDEIFQDVTPGLVPSVTTQARRSRVRGGEWSGPVAVSFTPPAGVSPGVAGTVIDGVANPHDVSATIVDLAARGWLRIEEISPDAANSPTPPASLGGRPAPPKNAARAKTRRDWRLVQVDPVPAGSLTAVEAQLLTNLFAAGPRVLLSDLQGSFGMSMREAQVGLYREVVDRGWYLRHPRAKNARLQFWGLFVTIALLLGFAAVAVAKGVQTEDWSLVPIPVGFLLAALLLGLWGRRRTPRTAEGTAARIQALGFKEYLDTAEADQIRFEEAGNLFSRYLPYAIAFGIAEQWARLFGEVAARAQLAGWTDPFWHLAWYDVADVAVHAASLLGDIGSLALDLPDIAGGLTDAASFVGEAVEGVAGAVGSVGDFADAADGLFSLGDGCGLDALDGCGCDF